MSLEKVGHLELIKYSRKDIMKLNSKDILSALKSDLEAAKQARREIDSKIALWKKEYNGEKYGNETKGRSSIVSRDIKKQSEWQHPALVEPFISTPDIIKANPVTYEDAQIAPKIEILLNTQFCRQFSRYNFINEAVKVLDQEGTCVIRTGWEYKEREVEDRVETEVPNPELMQLQQVAMQIQSQMEQLQAKSQIDPNLVQQVANSQGISPKEATSLIQEQQNPQIQQAMAGMQKQLEQINTQASSLPETVKEYKFIKRKVVVKNQPTAVVCQNKDVFIDPTCYGDFDKAQFIVYRYESDISNLKNAGIYKNLDKVVRDNSVSQGEALNDTDYYPEDTTYFRFKDAPRTKLLVYEYWGNYDLNGDGIAEPMVCTWVGDVIIRLEDNPFPDKKPPFIITPFSIIPFSLYGESNAELLSDIQKIKTAIYRGFIDNMALSNNGQKGIRMGALDVINKRRFMNGENFEFQGSPNDFYDGHFNELPGSIFNFVQLLNNESESITGVTSFNGGINSNALGGTALGIQGAMDSANTRRLNIVRNISENLIKPLLRKWLAYDAVYLDEESQFRITNDEFINIKRDDITACIDIELTISTSDDNKATANELAFLLQTLGPSENPELRQMIMADICNLYRRPDLARSIREFKPQADPMAQRMQELQLELLEAQVASERAKANRTEADVPLKEAKVETEYAKASNIGSRTDKQDLDYLQQYSGVKHRQNMEMKRSDQDFKVNENILKLLEKSVSKNSL